MPQIIMLNHAADINYKRSEARSKVRSKRESVNVNIKDEDPFLPEFDKSISELDSEELDSYFKRGF